MIWVLSLQSEGKLGILYKGRLTSILSKRKTFGFHTSFRYVVHLPTGESLTAFAICRLRAQLFSNIDNLFTALSSCCDIMKQLASFIAIKFTKQEWVRQWVSDKHCQWSDSGPVKIRQNPTNQRLPSVIPSPCVRLLPGLSDSPTSLWVRTFRSTVTVETLWKTDACGANGCNR